MGLDADLERIATAATAFGEVNGVLAADLADGRRVYVIALGAEGRTWVVVDETGRALDRRADVRDAASIVAMCELAADVAGGGDLAGLRSHLARLRDDERQSELDDAESALVALERTVGAPPRVASTGYLDDVGAATLELERVLGDMSSPFAAALRAGTPAVDAFVRDVERGYTLPLR